MAVLRLEIERAPDEVVCNEVGMRFRGFAKLLAKQRWPELIACERKNDLGHDLHEVETLPENDRVRYTISPAARKEVLKRLLAENHKRATAEAEAAAKTASSKPKTRAKKETKAAKSTGNLFQDKK